MLEELIVEIDPMGSLAVIAEEPAPKKPGKFLYSLGFELTAMSPFQLSEDDGEIVTGYAGIARSLLKREKVKFEKCFRDISCVEVTSGALKDWKSLEAFYKGVTKVFTDLGLQPHIPAMISGGGHIHVGGLEDALALNIIRDIQNRPYLNWCLNDPDDQTTLTYAGELETIPEKLRKAAPLVNFNPEIFTEYGELSDDAKQAMVFYGNPEFVTSGSFPDDKARQIRYKSETETLEYRFLRTPLDWDEQVAHVKFVEAHIKHIQKITKDGKFLTVEVDSDDKVKAFKLKDCEKLFLAYIVELGLPTEPYAKIMADNLEDRFKRGLRE